MNKMEFEMLDLIELNEDEMKETNGGFWQYVVAIGAYIWISQTVDAPGTYDTYNCSNGSSGSSGSNNCSSYSSNSNYCS